LFLIRVQAREVFKAGTDLGVKGFQGLSVRIGRHASDRVEHLAEGRALAEELQGNLRIRDFPQSFEHSDCFVDSFLSVRIAESRASDWAAEQLEVPIASNFEVGRKLPDVDIRHRASSQDEFALVFVDVVGASCAQAQTHCGTACLKGGKRCGHTGGVPCQAKVIEVSVDQLKSPRGPCVSQLFEKGLEGERKEGRP